jgi:hypothetical protein
MRTISARHCRALGSERIKETVSEEPLRAMMPKGKRQEQAAA